MLYVYCSSSVYFTQVKGTVLRTLRPRLLRKQRCLCYVVKHLRDQRSRYQLVDSESFVLETLRCIAQLIPALFMILD